MFVQEQRSQIVFLVIPLGCQKLYETGRYNVRKEPPRSSRMLVLVFGVYHRDWLLSVVGVGLADLLMSGEWSMLPMLLMPGFNL